MKQYFALIEGELIFSQDINAILNCISEEYEVCPEVPGRYQGIFIKPKGSKGESFAASSHKEFHVKRDNIQKNLF